MHGTQTEPITSHWTRTELRGGRTDDSTATASQVCGLLGHMAVVDIDAALTPYLAAAGAEMALGAGIAWRFSADDAPVALLRLIAKAALASPEAGGPHTERLLSELIDRDVAGVTG